MKKLLTKDYDNCFLLTLGLSESDQEAHYHNFIIDHYQNNPDIADGLKKAIDNAYNVWFRMAHDMALRGWEIDDEGKPMHQKLDDIGLPAFVFARRIGYSGPMLTGQFYKSFFDLQKAIIDLHKAKINKSHYQSICESIESDIDSKLYTDLKAIFDTHKEDIEKAYHTVHDKSALIESFKNNCDSQISKLKVENSNPYLKSDLTNYKIQLWEELKIFTKLLHKESATHLEQGEDSIPAQEPTKSGCLKDALAEYGFFELKKLKSISATSQNKLVAIIAANSLPYQIAMLDFLGFIEYLDNNYFKTKSKRNIKLSEILGSDKPGRRVAANIRALGANTNEDKTRYTSWKHKESVEKEYSLLK